MASACHIEYCLPIFVHLVLVVRDDGHIMAMMGDGDDGSSHDGMAMVMLM